jgi:hypothetical protein
MTIRAIASQQNIKNQRSNIMSKFISTFVLALTMTMVAAPGSTIAKEPSEQVLTAQSPTAMIVIKTEFWQPAPSMKSAFKLGLSVYDPVEGRLVGGPFGGGALIASQKKKFIDGYLIIPIKPGLWTFVNYQEQDLWALCFNAASLQFEVKAGEVIYLGEFDALGHSEQLREQVIRSGRTSIRGYGFADYFDLPAGPAFKPVDETALADVRSMLARSAPQITAPVRAAQYSPAKFGTGSTLFGERRCGGYFSKGVKKKGTS